MDVLSTYEQMIRDTRLMDGDDLVYPALGLTGEAGEVADKIKKFWRNDGITEGWRLNEEQRDALLKELGDVAWYLTALAQSLGSSLAAVLEMNRVKCLDRKARGVTKSEGDNR